MVKMRGEYSQQVEVICAKPIKKIVFPNGIPSLPLMHITQDDGKTYTYKYFLLNAEG